MVEIVGIWCCRLFLLAAVSLLQDCPTILDFVEAAAGGPPPDFAPAEEFTVAAAAVVEIVVLVGFLANLLDILFPNPGLLITRRARSRAA